MKNNIKIAFLFVMLSQVIVISGQDSVGFYYNAALPYVKYLPALGLAGAGLYAGGRYAAPYVKYLPALGLAGAGLYAGGKYATQRLGDSFNTFLNTISAIPSPDFSKIANVFSSFSGQNPSTARQSVVVEPSSPQSAEWVKEFKQEQSGQQSVSDPQLTAWVEEFKQEQEAKLSGEEVAEASSSQVAELVKEFEQQQSKQELEAKPSGVQSVVTEISGPQSTKWVKEFFNKNKVKLLRDFDIQGNDRDGLIKKWKKDFEIELVSKADVHKFLNWIFHWTYQYRAKPTPRF